MRIFPTLLLSCALVTTTLTAAPGWGEDGDRGDRGAPTRSVEARVPAEVGEPVDPADPHSWQTSDGVEGEIARRGPRYQRARITWEKKPPISLAPGVYARKWIERGPRTVRFWVVKADWKQAGVKVDYVHPPRVRENETVTTMLDRTPKAIAGINGDFFDIGDSGAPLGLGRGRRDGLWNGIDFGWNAAFWVDDGVPRIGLLNMRASIDGRRGIKITNVNSPQVKPGGIGLYTQRWGDAIGSRWTDGQQRNIRLVQISGGKVISNRTSRFPRGDFTGTYLVARGAEQSRLLAPLKVGMNLRYTWSLPGNPQVAITGNAFLLDEGRVVPTDNRELHPRTAVGIDRDHKKVIFLVADGRTEWSGGFTMVELARRLKMVGADDALNLDGGGSSTMVVRRQGDLEVLNNPSDGAQRAVANGLRIIWDPPKRKRKNPRGR